MQILIGKQSIDTSPQVASSLVPVAPISRRTNRHRPDTFAPVPSGRIERMKATRLHITGVVQGVGFRPFIYNLANELNLTGWVLNASDGVHVHVEGPNALIDSFPVLVERSAPAAAQVQGVAIRSAEVINYIDFEIRASESDPDKRTLISPDMATCPQCAAELFDPEDRRYRYPFINCTDCGPRFTIIEDVPYDRPNTSMKDFPMCAACAAEYKNPGDRRFHAQPDACWECGPRIYLNPAPALARSLGEDGALDPSWVWSPAAEETPRPHRDIAAEQARSNSIILEAVEQLHADRILAIKGLGGFHLAVNARNWSAVERLRERKHRYGKPLAVMFANIEQVRRYCEVSPEEQALLEGPVRPIVLLKRRAFVEGQPLADNIAQGMPEVGAVLPYTPLHHLLLDEYYGPLVMTSGNLSDEPIATDNAEALARLADIADYFVLHDRPIAARYDDSVVRVVEVGTGAGAGSTAASRALREPGTPASEPKVQMVRRARGYAPFPLTSPFAAETGSRPILAAGPEQKSTFTLLDAEHAFVSQHLGDLENTEVLDAYEDAVATYERLFKVHPRVIAYDLHPEYLSTKWAKARHDTWGSARPAIGVQHHWAHIVAATAEHGHREPVIGIAFDGTGYGDDGTIWGGEVLIADWNTYERFGHLRPLPLPGGAAAVKRPVRHAVGMLNELGMLGRPGALPMLNRLQPREDANVVGMIENGINCPTTTSMGRLFDAVAGLIGIADEAIFEGSPAILLEGVSEPIASRPIPSNYRFSVHGGAGTMTLDLSELGQGIIEAPAVMDPDPVIAAILNDIEAGVPAAEISRRFHGAVITMIGDVATKAALASGIDTVVLTGGCFMNRILLAGAFEVLRTKGFRVLTNELLPVNDGCVSFGQAIIAHEQLRA